ncbi:MAG: di-heme oxidoredictase family protein [Bacteroidota bacterium]
MIVPPPRPPSLRSRFTMGPHTRLGWLMLGMLALGGGLAGCTDPAATSEGGAAWAGGAMTVFRATPESFATPAPNLEGARLKAFLDGDAEFEQKFVTPPAPVNPGLGPLFNRSSCNTCHTKDGRTAPHESLLLRVSLGQDSAGHPVPVPGFGLQVQNRAVYGTPPEARVVVTYEEIEGAFENGERYTLRRPIYQLEDPHAPIPPGLLVSPRMARPVFGLGLLEAIPEETLKALVRQQAAEGAVSGRINYVWDREAQQFSVGRFGWKANEPTVREQTAEAYRNDMGITSPLITRETSLDTHGHDGRDDDPEIDDETLDLVTFYMQTLGVPAARGVGTPAVERGRALFEQIGCNRCHASPLRTGTLLGVDEASEQTIYPYTDLLVHDLGEGPADHRPDYGASGSEWRTPPLWGLGLTRLVNQHTFFLHDGRARNLKEAILWHGGEAEAAKERFRALSREDIEALLTFLESL